MDHSDTNPPAISVRGLTKTWAGGVEAVKGIDFEVAAGEVFGLSGRMARASPRQLAC